MGSQNRQLRFPNLIPSTRTLTQRQEASLRHFHRVTKSLRVPTGYTFLNRLNLPRWPQPNRRNHLLPYPTYNPHTRRYLQPWAFAEDIIDDPQLQRRTYREENTSFTLPCTSLPPTEARTSP